MPATGTVPAKETTPDTERVFSLSEIRAGLTRLGFGDFFSKRRRRHVVNSKWLVREAPKKVLFLVAGPLKGGGGGGKGLATKTK